MQDFFATYVTPNKNPSKPAYNLQESPAAGAKVEYIEECHAPGACLRMRARARVAFTVSGFCTPPPILPLCDVEVKRIPQNLEGGASVGDSEDEYAANGRCASPDPDPEVPKPQVKSPKQQEDEEWMKVGLQNDNKDEIEEELRESNKGLQRHAQTYSDHYMAHSPQRPQQRPQDTSAEGAHAEVTIVYLLAACWVCRCSSRLAC